MEDLVIVFIVALATVLFLFNSRKEFDEDDPALSRLSKGFFRDYRYQFTECDIHLLLSQCFLANPDTLYFPSAVP
jgi:hypothetical protein